MIGHCPVLEDRRCWLRNRIRSLTCFGKFAEVGYLGQLVLSEGELQLKASSRAAPTGLQQRSTSNKKSRTKVDVDVTFSRLVLLKRRLPTNFIFIFEANGEFIPQQESEQRRHTNLISL